MDNFEQLQQSWLGQPIKQQAVNSQQLNSQWRNRQLGVLTLNVFLTLGFAVALVILGCMYHAFHNRYSWAFSQGIVAIGLILILFLITTWKSLGMKQQSVDRPVIEFIDYQLIKLAWQRRVLSTYIWFYALLLWVAMIGFILTFTSQGLPQTIAITFTTFYILGISLLSRRYNKKKLLSIDNSILELKAMRLSL